MRISDWSSDVCSSDLFGAIGGMLALFVVILSVPLFITFFETGLVPRVPTAILCAGLVLIAVLNGFSGLILDTVTRGRREMKRLAYLAHAAPRSASAL